MQSNFVKLIMASVLIIATATTGCEKDNDRPPFDPVGYWRGQAYIYSTAIVNKADGSSRFYFRMPGNDTAKAETKLDGTYKITDDGLEAVYNYPGITDQVMVDSYTANYHTLTGLLILATGEAVTFDLRKQP